MNDYTTERLTYGEATLHLEDIHPVRVFMISVMTMVLRGELLNTRHILLSFNHFRTSTRRFCVLCHTLEVYWTHVAGKVLSPINGRMVIVLEVAVVPW